MSGFPCPTCGFKSAVIDSRFLDGGVDVDNRAVRRQHGRRVSEYFRRRRKCRSPECGTRFTTIEVIAGKTIASETDSLKRQLESVSLRVARLEARLLQTDSIAGDSRHE